MYYDPITGDSGDDLCLCKLDDGTISPYDYALAVYDSRVEERMEKDVFMGEGVVYRFVDGVHNVTNPKTKMFFFKYGER